MQPVLTSLKLSRTSYFMKKVVGSILNIGLNYGFVFFYNYIWMEEPGGLRSIGSQRVGHD